MFALVIFTLFMLFGQDMVPTSPSLMELFNSGNLMTFGDSTSGSSDGNDGVVFYHQVLTANGYALKRIVAHLDHTPVHSRAKYIDEVQQLWAVIFVLAGLILILTTLVMLRVAFRRSAKEYSRRDMQVVAIQADGCSDTDACSEASTCCGDAEADMSIPNGKFYASGDTMSLEEFKELDQFIRNSYEAAVAH